MLISGFWRPDPDGRFHWLTDSAFSKKTEIAVKLKGRELAAVHFL